MSGAPRVTKFEEVIGPDNSSVTRLRLSDGGNISPSGDWSGNFPDVNAVGHFVYSDGSQVYLDFVPFTNAPMASVGDAPKDLPDIVFPSSLGVNSPLISARFGPLRDYNGYPLDMHHERLQMFDLRIDLEIIERSSQNDGIITRCVRHPSNLGGLGVY